MDPKGKKHLLGVREGATREGGLVHRLDNGTSGALIIAREAGAFSKLREGLFRAGWLLAATRRSSPANSRSRSGWTRQSRIIRETIAR